MATLLPTPRFFWRDPDTDVPLVGGKVYTYEAGTTTPKLTWADADKTAELPNPIILDADGGMDIYAEGLYKLIVYRADDTLVHEVDNVNSGAELITGIFSPQTVYTVDHTITVAEQGHVLIADRPTAITFALDPAATLTGSFFVTVKNIGVGNLTIDPSGAETIDGAATKLLLTNQSAMILSDGTNFRTIFLGPPPYGTVGDGQVDPASDLYRHSVLIDDVADLKALADPSPSKLYGLKGYVNPGDIGENWLPYIYTAGATIAEDLASGQYSVIAPNSGVGRYTRIDQGPTITDVDYFLFVGQSNMQGSGPGGAWPANNQVRFWNGNYQDSGTNFEVLTSASRGNPPFPDTGDNNAAAHFLDIYQRKTGRRARGFLFARGGTSIVEMNQPGGLVYDGMISNINAALALDPNIKIKGFVFLQGEQDQFETAGWWVNNADLMLTNLRAQSWFPADTPCIFASIYFGEYSALNQWRQNNAISMMAQRGDPYVGWAPSYGLDAVNEGFVDSAGAPYRVHFTAASLIAYAPRWLQAYFEVKQGVHNPPPWSVRNALNGIKDRLGLLPITYTADGVVTLEQLASEPIIRTTADGITIILPNLANTALSSWRRGIPWRFTLNKVSSSHTVTINAGTGTDIQLDGGTPAQNLVLTGAFPKVEFLYNTGNRWYAST